MFDVTIETVDGRTGGITSLKFTFHEPIDKPGRHFYFGSAYQVAYPLRFRWTPVPAVTGRLIGSPVQGPCGPAALPTSLKPCGNCFDGPPRAW